MRVRGGGIGRALTFFGLLALALGLLPALAVAAPPQAVEQAALRALAGAGSGVEDAIVYRTTGPVPAGAAVRVAQLRGAASPLTGIGSGAMPVVLRAPSSEPAWLFYEDRQPNTLPEHGGRFVLVGAASGSAHVSGVVQGAPLVGTRWPRLLPVAPTAAGSGNPNPFPMPSPAGPSAPPTSPGRVAAAAQLAAAHACFLRAADTLGGFAPYASVRRSRAAAGRLAGGLAKLAPAIVSSSYRADSGASVAAYAQRAIDGSGRREVSLYLAGGGYRDGDEVAVAVGARVNGDGVSSQLLTGDDLRDLLRSRPGVTWDLTIDAPSAGALLDAVRGEPNLASAQASGRLGDPGLIARLAGGRERSLLRFSRGLLAGTRAMLADEHALATAFADLDSGRAPTFLAALLNRAYEQAVGSGGFDRFGVQPQSYLRGRGSGGGAGGGGAGGSAAGGSGGSGGSGGGKPVTPPNQAPTVTTTATALAYAENDAATALDSDLTVSDVDSPNLSGATVQIGSGYVEAEDQLAYPGGGGISASWDAASGKLTLSGTATVAAYQAALRAVTYVNLSDNPPAGARVASFKVDDGSTGSAAASREVEVTPSNDAPELQLASSAVTYTEGDAATPIDAALTLSDPDSPELAAATVKITTGLQVGEDHLEVSGLPASITASYDEATGTLTLTGPATVAEFQAALRAVTYRDSSDDPDTSPRTVSVVAEDTDSATTPTGTREVTVSAVNNAPVVTTTATALAYAENDAATVLDSGVTVSDVDSPNLSGATVQIGSGYVEAEDQLAYPGGGGISASWDAASGKLTLSGSATVSAYQAALRAVTYVNLSDNPPAGARVASIKVSDGIAGSAAASREVEVTPSNDAPDVALAGAALAYTENDPLSAVDSGASVSDPDSTELAAATVKVATGLQAAEDRLELIAPVAGITASYDEVTGTLTLTGPALLADFQTALRGVGYRNLSEHPSTTTRGISFQLTDIDGATGTARTGNVTVAAVNDPPVAVDDDGGETDEATPRTVAAPGVLANDTDADNDPLSVVAVNGQPAKVGVAVTSAKGASVTVNANGSFSYDPSGAPTLRALTEGESTTDTFTYAAGDGAASDTATVTVTVNGLPDPPEAVNDSYSGVGNTTLAVGQNGPSGQAFKQVTGSVLDNDSDPDTPHASLTVSAGTVASTLGGSATIASDGKFTYTPPTGTTGTTDTFTYSVSDGKQSDTGTVSIALSGRVWYVNNSAAAGGSGRSSTPFNTLAGASSVSSSGDTIYIFRGDGNSTGQNAGVTLKANQRLIGQADDLVVGGDTLFDGTSAQRPKIGNGSGTGVTLASGSRAEGLEVSASGGTAISAGSGVAGSTLADLVVAGNAGGVALSGTSGTFAVSDLAVTTTGSTAFFAENAGTVQFAEAGTISLASTGARALTAGNVALSGAIDSVSSTSSASGGVALASTTGSLAFGGLSIASSGSVGFLAENAAGLSIPGAATANVSNSGGPAVSIKSSSSPALAFDEVSSTNSNGAGFNVDTVSGGSVTASGGTISGAAGAAVDVNAGNGTVTYGGTIANGSGRPAEVTGRTGGTVNVSGNITETDTGILVSGNSGGTTEFSGASKSISTGANSAVTLTNNSGHTVSFPGGGLVLTTTSGKGFVATGGGTVTAAGSGNTVSSTTGTAVEVVNTTIGAAYLTFRSVSANGGANGIFLNTTGSSGGLVVTGNGTAESGGVIQNTVGADGSNAGVGVYLNSTADVSLSRMRLTTNQGQAIRGTTLSGFSLTDSTVNGTNGTNDAFDEGSVALAGLTGTAAIADTTIEGGYEDNLDITATGGTLNLALTRITVGANNKDLGGNGVFLLSKGTSHVTTTVSESHFTSSREDLFQHNVQDQAVDEFTFTGNELKNTQVGRLDGGTALLLALGGIENAQMTYKITGNSVRDATNGIFVTKGVGIGTARGRIANNTVGVAGVAESGAGKAGSAIDVEARGQGSHVVAITGNTVRNYGQSGYRTIAGEKGAFDSGAVSFDITASGNLATEPGEKAGAGWRTEIADPNSTTTLCLDLQGNTLTNSSKIGTDIRIFNDWPQDVFKLPGYAGGAFSESALEAYFAGRNTLASKFVTVPSSGNGYSSTTACAQPPA